jgi:microcystin-dependent protein
VGLGNVNNTSDADAPVSVPQQLALQQKQDIAVKGFAQGYASLDSAGKVPIEQIPSSLIGGNASFQTSWNAATNTPTIPAASAANNGFYYLVAVAGTTNIDGISSWAVGDTIISDGTAWKKITAVSAVSSVAGKVGVVTLVKGDVGLSNVDNTSDATKNAAAVALTNHTINGAQNTLTVRLDADVVNNLPTARLNGGTGAAANTWWCGDGTWKQPQGTGDTTGVASSVVGEAVVFADTDGKHIKGFSGSAGFAIFTPGNAVTTIPKIGPNETDPNFIHGLTEKLTPAEDDECVIWDSVTGQLMKVKKKNLGVPVATIVDWAGRPGNQPDNVANPCPEGWLICNGKSYPTASYPALFSVIGYGYGGSGANFNVPRICGRVTVARDYTEAAGGDTGQLTIHGAARYTIGGYFGVQTHTLNVNEMPAHQHYTPDHLHPVTHALMNYTGTARGGTGTFSIDNVNTTTGAMDRSAYTDVRGANGAHNNTQPTFVVWKIIKY